IVEISSNFLVQYPFVYFGPQALLTWGAVTHPLPFLVNDLTNRRFAPVAARQVVYVAFPIAVVLSIWLASPRLAAPSGSPFLVAQLLDVQVVVRLRERVWWIAPLTGALIGSAVDTVLFFSIAFSERFAFLDTGLGREDGSLGFAVPFL